MELGRVASASSTQQQAENTPAQQVCRERLTKAAGRQEGSARGGGCNKQISSRAGMCKDACVDGDAAQDSSGGAGARNPPAFVQFVRLPRRAGVV